jgi:uncharacterized surface protein with fasciclin (FAS1) repeats
MFNGPKAAVAPRKSETQKKSKHEINTYTCPRRPEGGSVLVDNANVVKTDVAASNGVIHVIDTVVLPK